MCYLRVISDIRKPRTVQKKRMRYKNTSKSPPETRAGALSPLITIASIKSRPNFNVSVTASLALFLLSIFSNL